MTILQINKYYYPRGGADVVMLELSKLLTEHGHRVVPFAMQSSQNLPSPYAHSFVSEVATESVRFNWQGIRTAGRMLYSFEARRKLAGLIRTTKPDIAHLHNIYHQISPSIFGALRQAQIPTVMTVHDWALLSPNYSLFDHGEICERGTKNPWAVVKHRCVKDSKMASAWAAIVYAFHKQLRFYERGVDRFIAPAVFVKDMLVEHGFSKEKITVIPHFVDTANITPSHTGEYIAYVGRLSSEKGITVLLEAARLLPDVPVKIAGSGPEEAALAAQAKELGLRNVEFVGRLDGVMRDRFYRNAMAIVVPSVWYEIFGRVVLEAYAFGKPVIASRIGALPEVVREGETGFLFTPGSAEELAAHLKRIAHDAELRARLGATARALVETSYAPELHYTRTMEVYASLLKS